jgi:hypothetical protein
LHIALNEMETQSLTRWNVAYALGHMIDYVNRFVVGDTGFAPTGFRRFFP